MTNLITRPSASVAIPNVDGLIQTHTMSAPIDYQKHPTPFTERTVLAAAHVVVDARGDYQPGIKPPIDWDATLAFREHLFSYGIGIAEAMDTTERGPGGLNWTQAKELIRQGISTAKQAGAAAVAGAGTDQILSSTPSLEEVIDAYIEQVEWVEAQDCPAVIRASHALADVAKSKEDYLEVYRRVLSATRQPAIVHWLGTGFDPSLAGYWGAEDPIEAMEIVVQMAIENAESLEGIKFSLLDEELECEFRRRLPDSVKVFTGDDYGYTNLLLGDGERHSHGLLGVLDPIAPIASQAFQALEVGDEDGFVTTMNKSIPLAVKMFETPADRYKTGTVFLAWLCGHQDHFRMVSGREGQRSLQHLIELFELADGLGLYPDPALAAHRMRTFLEINGFSEY